jgi:hypothetical protein
MMLTEPNQIMQYRMLTLRAGLRLEVKGFRRTGRSFYAIIKKEFGLKGNRESVLAQFDEMLAPLDQLKEIENV